MKDYELKSVGIYDGRVCMVMLDGKSEKRFFCQELAGCQELVYMRLRSLAAVASFRFLERALGVLARWGVPVLAMASSAGSFSVVAGAEVGMIDKICMELNSFAEVVLERGVEVICVQENSNMYVRGTETKLLDLLKDIPVLMVSSEQGAGSMSLTVRQKDREKVICLFREMCGE